MRGPLRLYAPLPEPVCQLCEFFGRRLGDRGDCLARHELIRIVEHVVKNGQDFWLSQVRRGKPLYALDSVGEVGTDLKSIQITDHE